MGNYFNRNYRSGLISKQPWRDNINLKNDNKGVVIKMTLSAAIFFGIGATVLWGGLLTTIIISMKKR